MNNIKITHELCAEDRARVDRLTNALEGVAVAITKHEAHRALAEQTRVETEQMTLDPETVKKLEEIANAEEPKNEPQESIEAETPATPPAEEEKPEEVKDAPVEEAKTEPTVTLAQIQQKVVQLCAGFEGKKKPAVREIISQYGAKVSDLKDQPEKWNEVWKKLTDLEEQ